VCRGRSLATVGVAGGASGCRLAGANRHDPDAPVGTFTHWLAWGISPDDGGLAEGQRAPREGRNDFREIAYRGPCPPRGDGLHRYFFRLCALAREPAVSSGASRRELERALKDNVLAVAELVGTYER
jgi:Raf kinase inhibitor-like YbhB/YbcL family protein